MSSQPTIKDVARLSGVSIGTVDRVLHNRGKVSEQNMRAVQSAIEALGYRPSPIARALVSRKSNFKIGVCIPRVETEFWAEAVNGAEFAREKLQPFGVEVMSEVIHSYRFADQRDALLRLLDQGVNALILTPVHGEESRLDQFIPSEIPYATVIEDIPNSRRLFHVGPDDHAMGLLAGRLALLYNGPGVRCGVLAANQRFCGTQDRIRGFSEFLAKHDPNGRILELCEIPLDTERMGYQKIYEITEQQMEQHPDMNLLYVTNGLTQWAAAAVKNHKKQGAIRVLGFEHTEMTCSFIQEGVICATVCQGPAQQWYNAINIMNEYLAGVRTIETPIFNAECRILIEESLPFVRFNSISDM